MFYNPLEPYAGKLARTVLRGERSSNGPDLPDQRLHWSLAVHVDSRLEPCRSG